MPISLSAFRLLPVMSVTDVAELAGVSLAVLRGLLGELLHSMWSPGFDPYYQNRKIKADLGDTGACG